MSFGLTNVPATFQRLIEKYMEDMLLKECLIFLDNILVFSRTFEEHISRLESLFRKLSEHNLKLKPYKCEFFRASITNLDHVVGEHGISADSGRLSAVKGWETPLNIKEFRQFL